MKRYILTLTLVFAALANAAAQDTDSPKDRKAERQKQFERIQAEKVAFFTSELDLTPQEAQIFWPVYNQCWKDNQKAHWQTMKAFGEIRKMKEKNDASQSEIEAKINEYVVALENESKTYTGAYTKIKETLPIEKVGRLVLAEEAFRMKMIRELKGNKKGKEPRD